MLVPSNSIPSPTTSALKFAALTPPPAIDTLPLDTEKSSESNEATPLADVVASTPVTETLSVDTVTSIPVAPEPLSKVKVSLIRSTALELPNPSAIVKSVDKPVNPLPSPSNEPVNVEPPASSPKLSPLTLPVPKSVATLSNCAEPEITPLVALTAPI